MVQCYGFVNRCQRISGTYFAVISRVISLIKIRILIVMANPVTPEKKGERPTTFKDTRRIFRVFANLVKVLHVRTPFVQSAGRISA